jgi:YD repeat-containing protein
MTRLLLWDTLRCTFKKRLVFVVYQRILNRKLSTRLPVLGPINGVRLCNDDRGELTKALAYLGTESDIGNAAKKMPNLQHEYDYDNAGNRTSANQTADAARVDAYTINNLNQVTARDNKSVIASGTVGNTAAVAVTVNGGTPVAADRQGSYWSKALTPGNSTTPDSADISMLAGSGSGAVRTETSTAYVGALAQSISRDADGNITGDGVWTYDWDAENRLIRMTAVRSQAEGVGACGLWSEFTADGVTRH